MGKLSTDREDDMSEPLWLPPVCFDSRKQAPDQGVGDLIKQRTPDFWRAAAGGPGADGGTGGQGRWETFPRKGA